MIRVELPTARAAAAGSSTGDHGVALSGRLDRRLGTRRPPA